jgi:CheY-like chemotaxis protein
MHPVILIVDDNEDNRLTLSMRLESCGYSKYCDRRERLRGAREDAGRRGRPRAPRHHDAGAR